MKRKRIRQLIAAITTGAVTVGLALVGVTGASAYQPGPADVFVAQNQAACNKRPCVLYPKTAQLPSGRIVAAFEDSQSPVVGQTIPIHRSDDNGTTWQKLADVRAPAYLSSDPRFARYTSNWTNPYLYVLPHDVGNLREGTLLLATIVSGDDEYYNEQKRANPNWQPTGDGDRRDLAVALYSSTTSGASWSFVNIIATGGWQGGSAGAIGRTSAANVNRQVDPVWEPHLVARGGQLIAYYSDENDYLGFNPSTGVPTIDPDNATAPDSGGQILVHKTWDGRSANWSQPVVDVPGLTQNRGGGKTQIGGGRPGMTTVAPTTDGRWLLTYEYFGGGDNVRYKIADDPLRFFAVGDAEISRLPVPAGGRTVATGGSPVLTTTADGRIVYNSAGSGSVWVNESGRSDGTWKEYQTTMPTGYSRNLQYVYGTGRILILQAAWAGNSIGPVRHGEVDLGRSAGTYSSLVNRLTGQVLSPEGTKTQDASLTGNVPDLVLRDRAGSDLQRWHVQSKGSNVTFLNKSGGRSASIWTGNATSGQRLAQWVDDNATDKQWQIVQSTDGFVKIRSARNPALLMTGATRGGAVTVASAINAAGNPAADDSQEWQIVADPYTANTATVVRGANSNRCLDAPNGALGAQIQIWDCVGNANQLVTPTPSGELRIAGRCIAAESDGTAAGTRAILWDCNNRAGQKWDFRVDGSIVNRSNGLVLDVGGFATANGSPVQLWTPLSNATQRWSRG